MIRLSLRTASPSQARMRSAALDLVRNALMEQLPILRRTVKPDDLPGIFKRAFERELERILIAQISEPGRSDDHRIFNAHYARYFTLLAENPNLLNGSLDSFEDLQAMGLTEAEADALSVLARHHRTSPAVSVGQLVEDLRASGIEPTETNLQSISRVIAAAYREANIKACDELGLPINPSEIRPLPPQLEKLANTALAPAAMQSPSPSSCSSPPSSPAPSPCPSSPHLRLVPAGESSRDEAAEPQIAPPSAQADQAPMLSVFAAEAIARKTADGAWHKDRRRDVEAAVAIFIAANGDVPINKITQSHLIAMKDIFPRLPREYGRERMGSDGKKLRETIAEAVARGDRLLEEWRQDPVKAENEGLPYVGLSLTTQKKHLTWISALITHVEGHYPQWGPTGLNVKAVRKVLVQPKQQGERHAVKSGQKKNEGRLPWKPEELAKLFNAPIWQGCAGIWNRLASGSEVYHDGNYWALLLLATTVARADEICGLAINDVMTGCDVPHLKIRETSLRRIKNQASIRGVPIASRIIDLGFLDYVAAIQETGHAELFPEYRHPSMGFDKVFYKDCFAPLRAHVFPSGTSQKRGRKDVDVQSIRTSGICELMRHFEHTKDPKFDKQHRLALAGHEPGDTGSKHYEDDFQPQDLLPQVDFLASFLPELPKYSLNLRPDEYRRFGKPRGRRKKLT